MWKTGVMCGNFPQGCAESLQSVAGIMHIIALITGNCRNYAAALVQFARKCLFYDALMPLKSRFPTEFSTVIVDPKFNLAPPDGVVKIPGFPPRFHTLPRGNAVDNTLPNS